MTRAATITGGADSIEQVRAFLPDNYSAVEVKGVIWIIGDDYAGWTLDGYVIPRLASGLIWATEAGAQE